LIVLHWGRYRRTRHELKGTIKVIVDCTVERTYSGPRRLTLGRRNWFLDFRTPVRGSDNGLGERSCFRHNLLRRCQQQMLRAELIPKNNRNQNLDGLATGYGQLASRRIHCRRRTTEAMSRVKNNAGNDRRAHMFRCYQAGWETVAGKNVKL
jgi:hypothetical protein